MSTYVVLRFASEDDADWFVADQRAEEPAVNHLVPQLDLADVVAVWKGTDDDGGSAHALP